MTMTQCKAFQLYPQMDGIAKPSPLPLKLGGGGVGGWGVVRITKMAKVSHS